MAGGLINIVTYGAQDIYLTGNPEITHFKVIYRRYTNFSIENIRASFDNEVGFGKEFSLKVKRLGDALSKTYLEIVLPEMKFKRTVSNTVISQKKTLYEDALSDMNTVGDFMSLNMEAYRGAYNEYLAENDTSITAMKNKILTEFNTTSIGNPLNDINFNIINDFKNLITGVFDINSVNLNDIAQNIDDSISKLEFMNIILRAVENSNTITKYYENIYKTKYDEYLDAKNDNYKFAWNKYLGHAIIDYIDVYIGGEKINRHYGEWIDIWYSLAGNKKQEETYFKMIGNVSELTTFDRTTKPKYILQIPLTFWFCRYIGLAIPLISLEYSSVTFQVKLKKLQELSYIERPPDDTDVDLDNLFENTTSTLNASMLLNYVFLDTAERRKFAISAHEYLIDQQQVIIVDKITNDATSIKIDFVNPTKQLIWLTQKQSYRENIDGSTQCKWNNYSISDTNPILTSYIEFNGYSRVEKQDGGYFNYVQPLQCGYSTPSEGINLYSFAIKPLEFQPTGSANFSRLSNVVLYITINPDMFVNDYATMRIYGDSYNVLRIIGGYGAIAFAV